MCWAWWAGRSARHTVGGKYRMENKVCESSWPTAQPPNSIELSGDAKSFDRVARKWNVDYAFYKTGPDKYLLFFKAGQADAMTACFSEYSRKVLSKAKSNRVPIREQLQQAADQLSKEKPKQKERAKEVAHEDR